MFVETIGPGIPSLKILRKRLSSLNLSQQNQHHKTDQTIKLIKHKNHRATKLNLNNLSNKTYLTQNLPPQNLSNYKNFILNNKKIC